MRNIIILLILSLSVQAWAVDPLSKPGKPPIATTTRAGVVKPDGTTIRIDLNGAISAATGYMQTEYDNGTCTTAATITPVNGARQKITLTNAQTCALAFTQPISGTAVVGLKIIQSAVSSYNGTISGCKWASAAVPTITATTGAVDFISVYLDGTNAYCAVVAQDVR
jgi:hypothetical protein